MSVQADIAIVGGGPAGASAAIAAARSGHDVLLLDAAAFPRDKPCGDGLTPRAVHELQALGLGDWLATCHQITGLRARGFGRTLEMNWPAGHFGAAGAAVPRMKLDARIVELAVASGARLSESHRVVEVRRNGLKVTSMLCDAPTGPVEVVAERFLIADGARSPVGKMLGRRMARNTPYGIAARSYADSDCSTDPWIASDLQMKGADGRTLPGYGWVFPLGDGLVNVGAGCLQTARRPAKLAVNDLITTYGTTIAGEWQLTSPLRDVKVAMLPMGGAVAGIAGPNWLLLGDAAGCVNPLNGEGIDYGLETGRLALTLMNAHSGDLSTAWPSVLAEEYGAAFAVARRLAQLLCLPGFLSAAGPIGMRSRRLMEVALRVMANLVVEADTDLVAKAWRAAGRATERVESHPPFFASTAAGRH